ncbi:casein kinase II subunit alpha [Nematocida sp. AWRm77]|nr:casein kinase II subunit alpha [Nematocida sp. AWRm77]
MYVETEARVYSRRAEEKGEKYYNYEEYQIEHGDINKYKINGYIGKGKYSQVFKGAGEDSSPCVIKVLKPVKEKKIRREAMILKHLKETEGVVELLDIVRDITTNTRSFVFKYEEYKETRELFKQFTLEDIKYYCRKILTTLDYCHSVGIFHRDIKPHNIIINHQARTLKIIDWGLAEFYLPKMAYSVGVASMHFKAPELLVNYKTYDYAIDIWAFGCVLCEMLLRRTPMFNGSSNLDQLVKIVGVLGKDSFAAYLRKYQITLPSSVTEHLKSLSKTGTWKKVLDEKLGVIKDAEERKAAADLLTRIFDYDHQTRPTARECLDMAFFL